MSRTTQVEVDPMKGSYTLIVHHEEGTYWGYFEELPTCYAAGDTLEACVEDAKAGLVEFLESMARDGQDPPPPKHGTHMAQVEFTTEEGKVKVHGANYPQHPEYVPTPVLNTGG